MERRSFLGRTLATIGAGLSFLAPKKSTAVEKGIDAPVRGLSLEDFLATVLRNIRLPAGSMYIESNSHRGDILKMWDGAPLEPFKVNRNLTYEDMQEVRTDWRKFGEKHTLKVGMNKHLFVSFMPDVAKGKRPVLVYPLLCQKVGEKEHPLYRPLDRRTAVEVAKAMTKGIGDKPVLVARTPWIPPHFGVKCATAHNHSDRSVFGRCTMSWFSSDEGFCSKPRKVNGRVVTFDLICGVL